MRCLVSVELSQRNTINGYSDLVTLCMAFRGDTSFWFMLSTDATILGYSRYWSLPNDSIPDATMKIGRELQAILGTPNGCRKSPDLPAWIGEGFHVEIRLQGEGQYSTGQMFIDAELGSQDCPPPTPEVRSRFR